MYVCEWSFLVETWTPVFIFPHFTNIYTYEVIIMSWVRRILLVFQTVLWVSYSFYMETNLSLSLSLCERIMQLFSCHSGLLQQWLLVCGPCASIYMLIYGITNRTHIESESETERERQRQREWENGREAQRRWYSRLDWSPGISNSNTAKQGYVYQIVRLLEI